MPFLCIYKVSNEKILFKLSSHDIFEIYKIIYILYFFFTFRLLIHGNDALGQQIYGRAILHKFENFPTFRIDYPSLLSMNHTNCIEEAILQTIKQASQRAPSILYWPKVVNQPNQKKTKLFYTSFKFFSDSSD